MNELIKFAELWLTEGEMSLHEIGVELNDILLSALATEESPRYGKPHEVFKKLANS